jgi:hypothetical protein
MRVCFLGSDVFGIMYSKSLIRQSARFPAGRLLILINISCGGRHENEKSKALGKQEVTL